MSVNKDILLPGNLYHIYNHGNADDNIFREEENYFYFLKRYSEFISPVADTYAYCLLPNHFHFIIKIKNIDNKVENNTQQFFSNLFNAYTKSFNKKYNRKGRLFLHGFKRKLINNKVYCKKAINYVHQNPIHHNFVTDINDWKFTSFHAIISNKETNIDKINVLELFGGIINFKNESIENFDRSFLTEFPY